MRSGVLFAAMLAASSVAADEPSLTIGQLLGQGWQVAEQLAVRYPGLMLGRCLWLSRAKQQHGERPQAIVADWLLAEGQGRHHLA